MSALIHSQEQFPTAVTGMICDWQYSYSHLFLTHPKYTIISQARQPLVSLLDVAVVAPRGKLHVCALQSFSFHRKYSVRVKILLE